jgi:hypothetical protein
VVGAADAVVTDLDVEVAVVDREFHGGGGGSGVFDDVGECFGDNEVGGCLDVGGQAWDVGVEVAKASIPPRT